MDLKTQIEQWAAELKWNKIVKELEKNDSIDRAPEYDLALATAYNKISNGDWKNRELSQRALTLLTPLEGEYGGDYKWYLNMGTALFDLQQWGRAEPYFRAAMNLKAPEVAKNDALDFLKECEENMNCPSFQEPFTKRVQLVWQKFSKEEASFRKTLSKSPKGYSKEVTEKCDEIFSLALDDPNCWVEGSDGKGLICPNIKGNIFRAFEILYLIEQAPESVLKNWKIQLGLVPEEPDDEEYIEDLKNIDLWITDDKSGLFSVSAYCKNWKPLLNDLEDEPYKLVYGALQTYLGELVYLKYFQPAPEILEKPLSSKPIPVSDFTKYLKGKGINVEASPDTILNTLSPYTRDSEDEEEFELRQDIKTGTTKCMTVLQNYEDYEDDFLNELEADGATAGFLFFTVEDLKGKARASKIAEIQTSLKKELKSLGKDVVNIIGDAEGETFGYVDIIAWDFDQVLDVAEKFFAKEKLQTAGYHTFRIDAEPIYFNDSDED